MRKLFCLVLAASLALSSTLYAQDKDKADKDKAAPADKDKAAPADKDKAAPADKDKGAVVTGVKEEEFVEFFGQKFSYIDIGGRKISPITLWGTLLALVVIAVVWFVLGRKKAEEGPSV